MMTINEFGLGAYHIGIMLLTHPSRLQHFDDLWIDCVGDEYASAGDGGFVSAPYFAFDDGEVEFDTRFSDDASDNYGSASAVCSQ